MMELVEQIKENEAPPIYASWIVIHLTQEQVGRAINDDYFKFIEQDPIGFCELFSMNNVRIELHELSALWTREYIRAFLTCEKYMVHFEEKIFKLFLDSANRYQRFIIAFLYIVNNPKISREIYVHLTNLLSAYTPWEVHTAFGLMIRIGITWTEDIEEDPIFKQYFQKAQFWEYWLSLV